MSKFNYTIEDAEKDILELVRCNQETVDTIEKLEKQIEIRSIEMNSIIERCRLLEIKHEENLQSLRKLISPVPPA
jgi:hypothetical protein